MLFSRQDLLKIIVPLVIEQTLAITIGMMDTMMVSSAGEAAVSGVSLVDSVNLLLIYLFSALATGGAVVTSQFLGKRDYDKANSSARQLIYVVFGVSSFIMAMALIFRTGLLSLIFGSIEADVMKHAKAYFLFTALSYPFLGLYNSVAAVFRSMGNSKISMRASLLMNLINVLGNAIFIFIFHLGAAGAAIATLISRIVGAVIMIFLLYDKSNVIYIEKIFKVKLDFSIIKNILKIGVPSGLENGMFQIGKLLTQSLVSSFGTAAIAANAVASTMASFQYIPGNSVGLALITIVGQCVGAGEKGQAKKYTVKLIGVIYCLIFIISIVMMTFSKQIIGVYNLSGESSALAHSLMVYHTICICTVWPCSFPLANAFRASSDVRYPMIISGTSMWIFRVGLSYVLGGHFGMGVFGVWIAMTSDWAFRGVLFLIHFLRGKWLSKYKPASVSA